MSEIEHRTVPPAGEEVHMPEPSIIPIVNAAALAIMIVSITLSWYVVVLIQISGHVHGDDQDIKY